MTRWEKKALLPFFGTPSVSPPLVPSLTHAHTQQGAIPNLRYSQPFTRSFIKQSWWKRKWGDTLPSSSFRCMCQVLAAGTQGLKALRHFLSHFITVSLYLTSWTRHIAAIIKQKKKLYLQLETDLFPVCKRHRPLFSSLNVTYWKAQCKDNR